MKFKRVNMSNVQRLIYVPLSNFQQDSGINKGRKLEQILFKLIYFAVRGSKLL